MPHPRQLLRLIAAFALGLPAGALAHPAPSECPGEEAPAEAPSDDEIESLLTDPFPRGRRKIELPTGYLSCTVVAVRDRVAVLDCGATDGAQVGHVALFPPPPAAPVAAHAPQQRLRVGRLMGQTDDHAQVLLGLDQQVRVGERAEILARQNHPRLLQRPPRVGQVGYAEVQLRGLIAFGRPHPEAVRAGGGLFAWARGGWRAKAPFALELHLAPLSLVGPTAIAPATSEGGAALLPTLDLPMFGLGFGGGVGWGDRFGERFATGMFAQSLRVGTHQGAHFRVYYQIAFEERDRPILDHFRGTFQFPLSQRRVPAWLILRAGGGGGGDGYHILAEASSKLRVHREGRALSVEIEPSLGFLMIGTSPFQQWHQYVGLTLGMGVHARF